MERILLLVCMFQLAFKVLLLLVFLSLPPLTSICFKAKEIHLLPCRYRTNCSGSFCLFCSEALFKKKKNKRLNQSWWFFRFVTRIRPAHTELNVFICVSLDLCPAHSSSSYHTLPTEKRSFFLQTVTKYH